MINQQLERHLQLVIEANRTTNITRIDSEEEARILHIEDSLAGLPEVLAAPAGWYADLGTGAGYPGIPIALSTGRETLLVDSVRKKTDILDNIIKDLQCENQIKTYHGRIEDLAKEHCEEFAVVTARALSKLSSLIELASPLLIEGGRLVCYKAKIEQEELLHAISLEELTGMRFVAKRDFELSDGKTNRCIIVFEKYAEPKIHLPRKAGKAQKTPLMP